MVNHMVTRETKTAFTSTDAAAKDLRSNCWPSVQSAESPDALMGRRASRAQENP